MRFEKDKKIGDTIKMNVVVYLAFIGIALGLTARYALTSAPRYPLSAACFACAAYMGVCLLRFIRLLKAWDNTYLLIEKDRVSGLSVDPKRGAPEPFEIGLGEVEDASLREVKLTQRTPLPALVIRTATRTYTVVGIENRKAARSALVPKNELF